jgi:hypothetical protein
MDVKTNLLFFVDIGKRVRSVAILQLYPPIIMADFYDK